MNRDSERIIPTGGSTMGQIEEQGAFNLACTMDGDDLLQPPEELRARSSISDVIFHPISTSIGVIKWAQTSASNRLANSVLNPSILSLILLNRIKQMTPQRARDATRLFASIAVNSVAVANGEQGKEFSESQTKLSNAAIQAASCPEGRDLAVNAVVSASKIAASLNTPETKEALHQITTTFESIIDLLASPQGKALVRNSNRMMEKMLEVAASPESAILLAEAASNIVNALEVEYQKNGESAAGDKARQYKNTRRPISERLNRPENRAQDEELAVTDTESDTEDMNNGLLSHVEAVQKTNRERCAEIEKMVLARMGIEGVDEIDDQDEIDGERNSAGSTGSDQEKNPTVDVILPEWKEDKTRDLIRRSNRKDYKERDSRDPSVEKTQRMARAVQNRKQFAAQRELAMERICRLVIVGVFFMMLSVWVLFVLYFLSH